MKAIARAARRSAALVGLALCIGGFVSLSACHGARSTPAESPAGAAVWGSPHARASQPSGTEETSADANDKGEEAGEGPEEGVALKPQEVEKMGIVTTVAQAVTREPEVSGFGVVVAHETIAQSVAELRTAIAAERQSRSALERARRLAATPGALPADTEETAQRQASVDQAALELARQRLSSTFGQLPPALKQDNSPGLLLLAGGADKLVRVTFPLAWLGSNTPGHLRLAHINAGQGGASWQSQSLWSAPADPSVPGRSFFAVSKGGEASEGEHLLAWAPVGAPEPGVVIPAAAVVVSAGKFWCYIEQQPGTFVRTEVDPSRPTDDGYFVKEGVSAGDRIVTQAAGRLLARETNPSTQAGD